MKNTMLTLFATLYSSLLILNSPAALPEDWEVDLAAQSPQVFTLQRPRGETYELKAVLKRHGKPFEPAITNACIYWQTNGMENLYWSAPASVSNNVLRATWLPSMDPGATTVRGYIGDPGHIYAAAFQFRFIASPGPLPNALPLPTPVIDFARVRVLNPPWSGGGGGGVDTNAVIDIANATVETNALVVATTNRVAALETATNNLTSSVSGLQSSKADKSTTYTKAETDAKLAGKANKNGDSIEDFAAKDINSIGTLTTAEILCGSTIHADGDINCFDSDGNLHHLVSKADRAESGDADEIATLDADGNPTRSGIAKEDVITTDGGTVDGDLEVTGTAEIGNIIVRDTVESLTVNSLTISNTDPVDLTTEDGVLADSNGKYAHLSNISATDPTFSNEVATVARTVTPPPSPTLRVWDRVRQCWWVGEMVNGVIQWEVE